MNTRERIIKRFYSESIRTYNAFADRAMSEPEYENIKDYAVNAYFKKQEPAKKQEVAAAYARIERGIANREDMKTIMDYYLGAERDYRLLSEAKAWMQSKGFPEPIRERFKTLFADCYILDIAREIAKQKDLLCETGKDVCGLLAEGMLDTLEVEHIDNEAREGIV